MIFSVKMIERYRENAIPHPFDTPRRTYLVTAASLEELRAGLPALDEYPRCEWLVTGIGDPISISELQSRIGRGPPRSCELSPAS